MKIKDDIVQVGVNDYHVELFEGMYLAPNGMAYNSYVILDEKIAVLDTVDEAFKDEWLKNVADALGGRVPDYLIVQHMEPDHSANILAFVERYPNAKIVASPKSFVMMKNFFKVDFSAKQMAVKDGERLSLGKRTLRFFSAPMVHWPEVIVSYEETEKILFSADAFGKFGTSDCEEEWECEARRYYFGIVGKYGAQVQALLKKLSGLEIQTICPLHGPILTENIGYYLDLYNVWSSYGVETDGVLIAYTSVYGNTKKAVEFLARKLEERGEKVALNDLARCDSAEALENAFRYGKTVLATTTYNGGIFPFMREFLHDLKERNFQNRTVALIENGSWSPTAISVMKELLSSCKNITFAKTEVKILSSATEEEYEKLTALANELSK